MNLGDREAERSSIATLLLYLKSKNCCATVELIINLQEGDRQAERSSVPTLLLYLKSKNCCAIVELIIN